MLLFPPPPPKQAQHFGEAGRLCKLFLLLVLLELAVVLCRFKGTVLLLFDVKVVVAIAVAVGLLQLFVMAATILAAVLLET